MQQPPNTNLYHLVAIVRLPGLGSTTYRDSKWADNEEDARRQVLNDIYGVGMLARFVQLRPGRKAK